MIHYISGGERSGKSRYAQELALTLSDNPIYLATARKWDDNFQKRIDRHVSERDERWTTIEEEKHLSQGDLKGRVVVIDCVTLWLTNWFMDSGDDEVLAEKEAKAELEKLFQQEATLIIISNEIGMGLHALTAIGRKFTELQGWVNQFIAARADKATFMVSGLPLVLK